MMNSLCRDEQGLAVCVWLPRFTTEGSCMVPKCAEICSSTALHETRFLLTGLYLCNLSLPNSQGPSLPTIAAAPAINSIETLRA